MKKLLMTIMLAFSLALSACGGGTQETIQSEVETSQSEVLVNSSNPLEVDTSVDLAQFEQDDLTQEGITAIAEITLNGDSADIIGEGVQVDGGIITIHRSGVYAITGALADGQIRVMTEDTGNVILWLKGAAIHNEDGPAIYILNAEKTILTLENNTTNSVSDGANYVDQNTEGEPNAAIFSHDDLTINGDGELTVTANFNNGIASKDDLKLVSGTVNVTAVNDGIKGKDSISVKAAIVTITAGADGMQSTNADEEGKGYIALEGGSVNILSALDGIQSAQDISLSGTMVTLLTGAGSGNDSVSGGGMWGGSGMEGNSAKPEESAKGLKASNNILISAGSVSIDSADDAIHANNAVTVTGGEIYVNSGDDGIHADASFSIVDGVVNIAKAYEGIESAVITVEGGTIRVSSRDDGFNVAGGADGSSMSGRPGENAFSANSDQFLRINGGYIWVNAGGDGLDSNGTMEINGGFIIVNGPTNNGNGALDAAGGSVMNGGMLVAVGSNGMAETLGESSTQVSLLYNFQNVLEAGTLIHIQDEQGNEVLTFAPEKEYQSIVVSVPDLQQGQSYSIYTGGSADGEEIDGYYSKVVYTPGELIETVTLESVSNRFGAAGSFGPGGGHGTRPGGQPPTDRQPPQ